MGRHSKPDVMATGISEARLVEIRRAGIEAERANGRLQDPRVLNLGVGSHRTCAFLTILSLGCVPSLNPQLGGLFPHRNSEMVRNPMSPFTNTVRTYTGGVA